MTQRINTDVMKRKLIRKGIDVSKCANCGSNLEIRLHHIIPLSLGGNDVPTNIVPLCDECHSLIHLGVKLGKNIKAKKSCGRKVHIKDGYLSISQLAEKYGMSKRNIEMAIQNNRLKATKEYSKYFVLESDFAEWQKNKWIKGWHIEALEAR